jgi:phage terminase large subunit-like protein
MAKKQTKEDRIESTIARQKEERVLELTREVSKMKNLDPLTFQQSVIKARIKELKEDLPHLHGWKWYAWAREFFESRNRMNLLCAANQIGKSSAAIRKNIEWACNKKLWPELWDSTPKQFWYFYPSDQVATIEVEKKWVPEFLPRGDMKNHEFYGWDIEYKSGDVAAIHFRSGCSIFFKSYGQKVINLQTSSVHMMTFDEEAPEEIINECLARLRATRGYFNQVFTATRGLQVWYRAMECIGTAEEMFSSAWKRSVSMRECMFYDDGTPSPWTPERIKEAEGYCTSASEILKRIDGRFVKDEGRRYLTFDPDKSLGDPNEKIPANWRYYAGVDIGSGGRGRSAGAIIIIACSPDLDRGRVVRTWRGDFEETTAKDILEKYKELKQGITITQACYDYQSREFGLIASRSGEPFLAADKQRNSGEQITNTLFQSGALTIDNGVYDTRKLVTELMSVPAGEKNRKYQDDLTDALRYVLKLIPWDFVKIAPNLKFNDEDREEVPHTNWTKDQYHQWQIKQRRGEMTDDCETKDEWQAFRDEVQAWNEAYGNW